jgi:prolipoprotein diacylglyceryltransferase
MTETLNNFALVVGWLHIAFYLVMVVLGCVLAVIQMRKNAKVVADIARNAPSVTRDVY